MSEILRHFREKHMKKKIAKTTSLKKLEKHWEKCPPGLQPLILTRYKELLPEYLERVTSFKELEERYKKCLWGMGQFILARYKELLERATSREELEQLHEKCITLSSIEILVSNRYEELLKEDLKDVTSWEELDRRREKCPSSLRFVFSLLFLSGELKLRPSES